MHTNADTLPVPTVSIGLPVYNREKFIAQTLDALLTQPFTDVEIIVSDNASTDATASICENYAARDSRIRYIRQPHNIGMLGNFNAVKQAARGKYFAWNASDDLCEPEFISTLVTELERDPELVLVMSDLKYVSESGLFIKMNELDTIRLADVQKNWPKKRLTFFQYPGNKNWDCFYGLYRTEVAHACHLPNHIRKNLVFSLEIPFLAQVAVKGKIASIARPLKVYRYYPTSSAAVEASRLKFRDRLTRGIEIWHELALIALRSRLAWPTRLRLVLKVMQSSIRYMISSLFVRQNRIVPDEKLPPPNAN